MSNLSKKCPKCGRSYASNVNYCTHCGSRLVEQNSYQPSSYNNEFPVWRVVAIIIVIIIFGAIGIGALIEGVIGGAVGAWFVGAGICGALAKND